MFQQHRRRFYTWISPDGQYWNQIYYILCSKNGEAVYSQQKQDQELTVAWIMNSFAKKGSYSQTYVVVVFLSSSLVWVWDLNSKEVWWLKNWCFQIVVLVKTLENCLDCKESKPGNQCWIFIGRTDAEAEAPILCPYDSKSQLTGKDSNAGNTEGKRRR